MHALRGGQGSLALSKIPRLLKVRTPDVPALWAGFIVMFSYNYAADGHGLLVGTERMRRTRQVAEMRFLLRSLTGLQPETQAGEFHISIWEREYRLS